MTCPQILDFIILQDKFEFEFSLVKQHVQKKKNGCFSYLEGTQLTSCSSLYFKKYVIEALIK